MSRFLRDRKELTLYAVLWLLVFLAPVVTTAIHSYLDSNYQMEWGLVLHTWKVCALFLVAFLIHNFFCAPVLIYRHQRVRYVLAMLTVLVLFTLAQCATRPQGPRPHEPLPHDRGPMPEQVECHSKNDTPHFTLHTPPSTLSAPPRPPFLMPDAEWFFALLLFLLFGLNLGVKIYFKYERDRQKMQELKSQNLEHQLAYLKYQINPHFFMNTLNNIHALVDIDPEQAKSTIVELSKMMRYILYEGNNTMIPLQRERDFINHYVRLMRMRYTDKVHINLDMPLLIADGQMPPLLLITFVENAFKHGITYKKESFIDISLVTDDTHIYFSCRNSKAEQGNQEQGGVGLANVRQRLDIIYGDRYTYDIHDTPDSYQVTLTLPLNNA